MSDKTEKRPMRRGPGGPHGPGPRVAAKPKDFKKPRGKLILCIKRFIAGVLEAAGCRGGGFRLNTGRPSPANQGGS